MIEIFELFVESLQTSATASTSSSQFAIAVFLMGASLIFPYLEKRDKLGKYSTLPLLFFTLSAGIFLAAEFLMIDVVSAHLAGIQDPGSHAEENIHVLAIFLSFFATVAIVTEDVPEASLLDYYISLTALGIFASLCLKLDHVSFQVSLSNFLSEPLSILVYPLYLILLPLTFYSLDIESRICDKFYNILQQNIFWTTMILSITAGLYIPIVL